MAHGLLYCQHMPMTMYLPNMKDGWDAVRRVRIGGRPAVRHILQLKPEHAHRACGTSSLGYIRRCDVGRFYVLDKYDDGGDAIDVIDDKFPLHPRRRPSHQAPQEQARAVGVVKTAVSFPVGTRVVHAAEDKVGCVARLTKAPDVVRVHWDGAPSGPFDPGEPVNVKHLVKGTSS